jgi:hypothetical protein
MLLVRVIRKCGNARLTREFHFVKLSFYNRRKTFDFFFIACRALALVFTRKTGSANKLFTIVATHYSILDYFFAPETNREILLTFNAVFALK